MMSPGQINQTGEMLDMMSLPHNTKYFKKHVLNKYFSLDYTGVLHTGELQDNSKCCDVFNNSTMASSNNHWVTQNVSTGLDGKAPSMSSEFGTKHK